MLLILPAPAVGAAPHEEEPQARPNDETEPKR
jgi:hypothetical protein